MRSTEYPYTTKPGAIRDFLNKIGELGVPDKITHNELKTWGFTSTNDRPIITVLKFIGFLDNSVPSALYKEFRIAGKSKSVMASSLKRAYADLYKIYPLAHTQSAGDLKDFFAAKSDSGQKVLTAQVATFKVLCEFAEFASTPKELFAPPVAKAVEKTSQVVPTITSSPTPQVHINLQIHLPQSTDAATYDRIFQAIAKHLMKGSS